MSETEVNNTATDLSSKTIAELKEICKARGLKYGGNKTQLLERLNAPAAPADETPQKRAPKRKRNDAKGVDEYCSSSTEASPLDKVQAMSNALNKSFKRIQNYIWQKGAAEADNSQEHQQNEEEKVNEETKQDTEADIVGHYLKEHEHLFQALARDCRSGLDPASPEDAKNVLQTFYKVLEAVEKNIKKLRELELEGNVEEYLKAVCVAVDGNIETPRVLPFNEALHFAWFLVALCATLVDESEPIVFSLLNTIDGYGVDPVKCHADFEHEHGYLVTPEAWDKLHALFARKEEWKVNMKKGNSKAKKPRLETA